MAVSGYRVRRSQLPIMHARVLEGSIYPGSTRNKNAYISVYGVADRPGSKVSQEPHGASDAYAFEEDVELEHRGEEMAEGENESETRRLPDQRSLTPMYVQ